MSNRIPWILLVLAGMTIVVLWLQNARLQDELIASRELPPVVEPTPVRQTDPVVRDSLSVELPKPELMLKPETEVSAANTIEQESENVVEKAEPPTKKSSKKKPESYEEIIREKSNHMVSSEYVGLFEMLALDVNTDRAVRDVLARGIARRIIEQKNPDSRNLTFGERRQQADAISADIDDELQSLLTYEELALWREYDETHQQRQLETSFHVMMARDQTHLSGTTRDTVAAVLTDEWILAEEAFANELTTKENEADLMTQATDAALDRLYEELDEDDYAIAEDYLQTFLDRKLPSPTRSPKSIR